MKAGSKKWTTEYQREFFDHKIAKALNIKRWEDWYQVKKQDYIDNGAGILLKKYYSNSRLKALSTIYPEHEWEASLFRTYMWKDPKSHRQFTDELAKKIGIASFDDWYDVTKESFYKYDGGGLLKHYYNDSASKAIMAIYNEHNWDPEKFKSSRWTNINSHRAFLENDLAKALNIKRWEDWYHVRQEDFHKHGGGGLLVHYYNNSPHRAITTIFHETPWETHKFKIHSLPDEYWNADRTRKFFAFLIDLNQWKGDDIHSQLKRITRELIETHKGGYDLLAHFKGSLYDALRTAYPELEWNKSDFQGGSKPQQDLMDILARNLPLETKMIANYRHPLLMHKSSSNMELDIWIPQLNLAIEYHGQQHFQKMRQNEAHEAQKKRDAAKIEACKERGIDLVVIPFWWDSSEDQVLSTIRKQRPDLFNKQ